VEGLDCAARPSEWSGSASTSRCLDFFRRAVGHDPGFALAHYQIARLGEVVGLPAAERQKHIQAAGANGGRLGEKERLLIGAWRAHMENRNEEAHRIYAQAVEAWPHEKDVLYLAADLFFHENRCAEAQPLLERALQLDPTWEQALIHLADCLREDPTTKDEFLALTRRWAERAPGPHSYRLLAAALAQDGKLDEALEKGRRAYEMEPNQWNRQFLALVLLYLGDFAEAEALLKPVITDQGRTERERARAAGSYAATLALQGRRKEARRVLDAMRDIPGVAVVYHEYRLLHFVGDGATAEARAESDLLLRAVRETPPDFREQERLAAVAAMACNPERAAELVRAVEPGSPAGLLCRAMLAWQTGRIDAAAADFRPLADRQDHFRHFALYALGDVEEARGRHAEALAALDKFRAIWGGGYWTSWARPRSQIIEARALEALGRRNEAQEKVRVFLETWRDADPDLPLLAEAKALQARLASGAAAR
jgi:tetratricopeptide (TPR) repeat protein